MVSSNKVLKIEKIQIGILILSNDNNFHFQLNAVRKESAMVIEEYFSFRSGSISSELQAKDETAMWAYENVYFSNENRNREGLVTQQCE